MLILLLTIWNYVWFWFYSFVMKVLNIPRRQTKKEEKTASRRKKERENYLSRKWRQKSEIELYLGALLPQYIKFYFWFFFFIQYKDGESECLCAWNSIVFLRFFQCRQFATLMHVIEWNTEANKEEDDDVKRAEKKLPVKFVFLHFSRNFV